MQAAGSVCFSAIVLPLKNTKSLLVPRSTSLLRPKTKRAKLVLTQAAAGGGDGADSTAAAVESVVDYSSLGSVFPAEACETIGGEACDDVAIYPEARLTASTNSAEATTAVEEFEREYLDYNQQKTVFPGEACDDLGGEFCGAEYQIGVGKEKAST